MPMSNLEMPMSKIICEPGSFHFAAPPRTKIEPLAYLVRTLDIVLALLALVFVLPLMGLVALAVFAQDGGPILFFHRRIGRNGKPFYCWKFRSMATDAEARLAELLASDAQAQREWAQDHKLRNDPRVTRIGAFLRRSSLDELPQLFNVLHGTMSLVGPRPIVDAEIPRYGKRFRHYCSVKPGITGLWQISGRNDVEYRTRVALDCLYARSQSPALYVWIVVLTIPAVLTRKGSY
ncbi:MAG TPA: sugar transferase [Stellaceae bacterium]|nr:sugar transferase [Stellaceae bacterium]